MVGAMTYHSLTFACAPSFNYLQASSKELQLRRGSLQHHGQLLRLWQSGG